MQRRQYKSIDLNKVNPDWTHATLHAKSVRPGFCQIDNPVFCPCCSNIIHQQKIPICIHAKELQFLGFGFPLWYSFLKYCVILILMLIVSTSIQSVYRALQKNKQFCKQFFPNTKFIQINKIQQNHSNHFYLRGYNIQNNHLNSQISKNQVNKNIENLETSNQIINQQGHHSQHKVVCTGIFILLSRIDNHVDNYQIVSRIASFIIILLTLLFMRDNLYKTQQYYDERRCSLNDYSIIISKIPKIERIQSTLKQFFNKQFNPPVILEEIILIPEYQQLQQIIQQKSRKTKQLQKLMIKGEQQNVKQIQLINKKLKKLDDQEQEQIEIFKKQMISDKLTCQRAIIVVSTQAQKQRVLEQFQAIPEETLQKYFKQEGSNILIDQAPRPKQIINILIDEAPGPKQIIWENINYPDKKRYFKVFIGWGLSTLFIIVVTLFFYFVLKWKTHIVEEKKSLREASIIVYIAIFSVILFNKFIMGHVLHYFTDLQMHATSDRFQFSFAFKYALGMFFTTALMTLFVEAYTYKNFYTHHYGVIQQQSIMFFMNALLVPLIWLINPFHIHKLIKRHINYGKKHFTQHQANKLMQHFQYDIGKRYAQILQSMWFTFLYASLIPMGAFLMLIGIGFYYWVDKYNLLRRSSVHENVSGKLSLIAMKLLDAILIFFPLGQIIFDSFLKDQVCTSSIICFSIGIIYLILPINYILNFINEQNFNLQEKQYRDVKHTFKDTYFNKHPIYQRTHTNYNKESRIKFKEQVLKHYNTPVFSFVQGWILKDKNSEKDIKLIQNQSQYRKFNK